MKDKNIIFHIPFKIDFNRASGSQIRPIKMIKAFEEIGYNVDIIQGYLKERSQKIKQIKRKIRSGVNYEFVYSESSTAPTALTEKHHLPIRPFLDFKFFKFCKRNNIPIGLFYRDIYWNFENYKKQLPLLKRKLAIFFYKFDIKQYNKWLKIMFLPSVDMIKAFPIKYTGQYMDLPPASDSLPNSVPSVKYNGISIIYVGGLNDNYQMHLLFKVCSKNSQIKLNVVCRKEEWEKQKIEYIQYMNNNIKIHHASGKDLLKIFKENNIASLYVEPDEYRKFAMPLKIFEYMANNKPILCTKNTAAAKFIEKNDIGWSIDYDETELTNLLYNLIRNSNEITEKIFQIEKVIEEHRWKNRAEAVSNYMKKNSKNENSLIS